MSLKNSLNPYFLKISAQHNGMGGKKKRKKERAGKNGSLDREKHNSIVTCASVKRESHRMAIKKMIHKEKRPRKMRQVLDAKRMVLTTS